MPRRSTPAGRHNRMVIRGWSVTPMVVGRRGV